MEKTKWIRCPVCGNKTRLQIREDTELKNFDRFMENSLYPKGDLRSWNIKNSSTGRNCPLLD